MRKILIVPTLVFALGAVASPPLFASDEDVRIDVPRDQWLTMEQITEKLAFQGYDVRRVKVEGGVYEVYAIKDGQRVEALVHPATGALLKNELDD